MAFSAICCGLSICLPLGFFSFYYCVHRDERRHTRVKSSPVRDGRGTGDHQREGVLVKTKLNDSKLEQHQDQDREEKPSPLSSESNWSSHQLSINGLGRLIFECQRIQIKS